MRGVSAPGGRVECHDEEGSGGERQQRETMCLVFGREDTGFSTEELLKEEVRKICAIPMSSRFGTESLSLSQAVPIVLARLFEHSLHHQP